MMLFHACPPTCSAGIPHTCELPHAQYARFLSKLTTMLLFDNLTTAGVVPTEMASLVNNSIFKGYYYYRVLVLVNFR